MVRQPWLCASCARPCASSAGTTVRCPACGPRKKDVEAVRYAGNVFIHYDEAVSLRDILLRSRNPKKAKLHAFMHQLDLKLRGLRRRHHSPGGGLPNPASKAENPACATKILAAEVRQEVYQESGMGTKDYLWKHWFLKEDRQRAWENVARQERAWGEDNPEYQRLLEEGKLAGLDVTTI